MAQLNWLAIRVCTHVVLGYMPGHRGSDSLTLVFLTDIDRMDDAR